MKLEFDTDFERFAKEPRTEHRKYKPSTPFGKAVAESGFSRVCPAFCGRKWSDRMQWVKDTIFIGNAITSVGFCAVRICSCGEGKMIAEGRSTNGLKPGPTERPQHLFEHDKLRAEARKREPFFKSKGLSKSRILRKRAEQRDKDSK